MHMHAQAYLVSVSVLCIISMISTMCRSIGSFGPFLMANTASTTIYDREREGEKWEGGGQGRGREVGGRGAGG